MLKSSSLVELVIALVIIFAVFVIALAAMNQDGALSSKRSLHLEAELAELAETIKMQRDTNGIPLTLGNGYDLKVEIANYAQDTALMSLKLTAIRNQIIVATHEEIVPSYMLSKSEN